MMALASDESADRGNELTDTSSGKTFERSSSPGKIEKRKKKKRKNKKKSRLALDNNEQNVPQDHYEGQEDAIYEGEIDYNEYSYNGELLMHTYYTLPSSVQKFWSRRYELFTKYDEGIYLSAELWYSVTPETIAKYIAQLFVKILPPEANYGLDVCCGGGGNMIQFAQFFDSVGGIEINGTNLYCAEHNAEVYGVQDKTWTVQADWRQITQLQENHEVNYDWIPQHVRESRKDVPPNRIFDFIFSSPPWGGTNYDRNEFNLYAMQPFNITELLQTMTRYSDNVGLFLPKSSSLMQLSLATKEVYGDYKKCRAVYINSKGRCIALLALFGDCFTAKFDELDDISEEALIGTTPEATAQDDRSEADGTESKRSNDVTDIIEEADEEGFILGSSSEEVESDIG
ncbi:tgs1 [Candida margitis]|uniref:tgs1 n=1 Tax=Candida margitis TaxID=1775924 RepID=UPI002227F040|nr:tgs1 [Candida margitis]KAI5969474.1 tgs1 [Candida margitis]